MSSEIYSGLSLRGQLLRPASAHPFRWPFFLLSLRPHAVGCCPTRFEAIGEHLLGTDSNGQDIFWQATFAVRNSLIISLIAALVSRVIAVLVGMISGYKGGRTDRALMFISDSLLVIPLFLIIVMLAMLVRESMNLVILGLLLAVLRLGMGRARDPLADSEPARAGVHQDGHPLRDGNAAPGIERIHALCHAVDLLDFDQQHGLGDWVGDHARHPRIGQSADSHPGHDAELGDHLPGDSLRRWWWVLTPVVLSVFLFIALYWLSVSISEYLDPRTRIQRVGAE